MLRFVLSIAGLGLIGCNNAEGLQSFYILGKTDTQIELVQVKAQGVPFMGQTKLGELAELHCVGPATLVGTRRLDAARGGHKVFVFRCS